MSDAPKKSSVPQKNAAEEKRIADNKAWLTPPIERVDVGLPSVDASGTPIEHGGPKGPEPTRYGDWEKKGICIDF